MRNELVPYYSEEDRDRFEREEAEKVNKPEIHYERRYGLDIHVYYLRKLGIISMALLLGEGDERYCREFTIPNDRVNDAIESPELYAWKAKKPRREYE